MHPAHAKRRYGWLGCLQLAVVVGFLILTGWQPRDRPTWLLEVSWIIAGLVLFVIGWRRGVIPSALLSWSLTIHSVILIYGAWYTYEHVPLGDWAEGVFGFERNHYDRLGHFAQGFFPAVLVREVLIRKRVVNGRAWLELVVFVSIMAFSAFFELLEFAVAMLFGDGATAYLGTQGDVWDAQWDLLYCAFGGSVSIALFSSWHTAMLRKLRAGSEGRELSGNN